MSEGTMVKGMFNLMCDDPNCKENSVRPIYRGVCRNNCKHWKHQEKKCKLGYNNK